MPVGGSDLRTGEGLSGAFRPDEAAPGQVGYHVIPGGYPPLLPEPEEREGFQKFHTIIRRTVEQVSAGLPVALTVSDYTGHTCALWEEYFPGLRQMALEQCTWSMEQAVSARNEYLFVFKQLPKELYGALYRCINMEIPYEDVYLNCSVLPTETPLRFDSGSAAERTALVNLRLDWDHLVLMAETAPHWPVERLTEALSQACALEGWIFSDRTKK